jgi:hypothetical protein
MQIMVNGIEYGDEKDALKAVRKAKKQEAINLEHQAEIDAKARNAVYVSFYKVTYYCTKVMADTTWFPDYVLTIPKTEKIPLTTFSFSQQYDTPTGKIIVKHIGYKPVFILNSTTGEIAVCLEDETGKREWNVIGVCEDRYRFLSIPEAFYAILEKVEVYKSQN